MSTFKSFRPTTVTREVLEDVEYGKRSDLINRCIERYAKEELKIDTANKDFHNGKNEFTTPSPLNDSGVNSTKASKDQAASAIKQPESAQNILRKLLTPQQ